MTLRNMNGNDAQAVRKAIDEYISGLGDQLLQLNKEARIPNSIEETLSN